MDPEASEITQTIPLPCENLTKCTFGGPNLNTLFATKGTFATSTEERAANPLVEGLFATEMETPRTRTSRSEMAKKLDCLMRFSILLANNKAEYGSKPTVMFSTPTDRDFPRHSTIAGRFSSEFAEYA